MAMQHLVSTIVSGGQTGADRAALDWAIEHGVPHGGWCPLGRLAEDGALPPQYQLQETEGSGARQRTKRNVRDSDATLIVNLGELDGGSLATLRFAEKMHRPVLVMAMDEPLDKTFAEQVRDWLRAHPIHRLNVAGPRESKRPGIYHRTRLLLDAVDQIDGAVAEPGVGVPT